MPDTKLSALTELAEAPASNDLVYVDDISAGTAGSKKLTVANLFKSPTLGAVSGDTLTINAGTWTIANNFAWTRAVGALPAGGPTIPNAYSTTFSGDSGGTSSVRAYTLNSAASGSNAIATYVNVRSGAILSTTSGATTTLRSVDNGVTLTDAGTATNSQAFNATFTIQSSGGITDGSNYLASAPTLSSTGAITTLRGFMANDLGHATLVTTAVGHDCANFTAAATLTAGFRSQMNSGTGKWGFYASGTANNAFNGSVRIGSTTAPGVALDVTGALQVSGNVGFYGTSAVAQSTGWGATNVTTDKAFNANATSIDELADVLGTLIDQLKTLGLLGA